MTLGATSVPAGSLLVFNGYPNPDRVIAVNPATGAVIASLTLDANYDLTGAALRRRPAGICSSDREQRQRATASSSSTPPPARDSAASPRRSTSRAGRAWPSTRDRPPVAGLRPTAGSQLVEYHRRERRAHRTAPHRHPQPGHQPERDLRAGLCRGRHACGSPPPRARSTGSTPALDPSPCPRPRSPR